MVSSLNSEVLVNSFIDVKSPKDPHNILELYDGGPVCITKLEYKFKFALSRGRCKGMRGHDEVSEVDGSSVILVIEREDLISYNLDIQGERSSAC